MYRMRAFALCTAVATASAQKAAGKLLWYHNEPVDIYSTAAVSRQTDGVTFSAATDLNVGYVDVFNLKTPNGTALFSYIPATGAAVFVDMARHASGLAQQPVIDTFVLWTTSNGTCFVNGFYSDGPKASGTPAWTTRIDNCNANEGIGAAYTCFEASDDGSLLVLQGYGKDARSGNATASAWGIAGQSGAQLWQYDLGLAEGAGQGDIAVTPDGSWVAYVNQAAGTSHCPPGPGGRPNPNCAQMHVLDGKTGKLRGAQEVQIPFFIAAAISDSGAHVIVQNWTDPQWSGLQGTVLTWNPSSNAYEATGLLAPKSDGLEYDIWDMQSSTLADGTEIAILGWISAPDVKHLRVNAWNLSASSSRYPAGQLLTDWTAPASTSYQNNPTIRADGGYIAVALWGDSGNTPTTVLLAAGSNEALFTHISPGSMFSVDVVLDPAASTPSTDVLYIASAGKHVPANVFGNGGDAYAWQVTVSK